MSGPDKQLIHSSPQLYNVSTPVPVLGRPVEVGWFFWGVTAWTEPECSECKPHLFHHPRAVVRARSSDPLLTHKPKGKTNLSSEQGHGGAGKGQGGDGLLSWVQGEAGEFPEPG